MVVSLVVFFTSFVSGILLIPRIRSISLRKRFIAYPSENRWHKRPTAILGGVGIFTAYLIGVMACYLFQVAWVKDHVGLLAGGIMMFGLGLYDDVKPLSAYLKFLVQILAASLIIGFGYSTEFFSPRLSDPATAQILNIGLTYFWVVGITNAINLLDNMDGLASGVSLIAAIILSFFFWRSGEANLLVITLALAGSIMAFLIYNFPPASIFMGDSGSLFIGFTLAVLAISRQPQASNVIAVLGVPTLIFLLPILDLGLVTLTRLLTGRSVIQGGRDHTSHRLIAFGFTERQVLIGFVGIAMLSGIFAAILESINYWYSLFLVPVIIIILALVTAYLGGVKLSASNEVNRNENVPSRIIVDLTFRWRLLEIILDLLIIILVLYLSIFLTFGKKFELVQLRLFFQMLPAVIVCTYFSFYLFGVYHTNWRYFGQKDLLRFVKAAIGCLVLLGLSSAIIIAAFPNLFVVPVSPILVLNYSCFLLVGCVLARSIFRMLNSYASQNK